MIAFVSLFLGIVLGPQMVEVSVGDDVAQVVLRMNRQEITRLDGPPWRTTVDFGDALVPHHLEAVALDAEGVELNRVTQWINLPQPPARSSVVIEAARDDQPAIARLTWESVAGGEPSAVSVTFDGQPLDVTDPQRIELPRFNASQLHFLRAELTFSENVTSLVEATLGGTYSDQVSTELTAVAVEVPSRRTKLTVDAVDGHVLFRGEPLRVVAVDQATPSVLIVPDRGYRLDLNRVSSKIARQHGVADVMNPRHPLRFWARVSGDPSIKVLWPMHRQQSGAQVAFQLFATSQDVQGSQLGLMSLLLLARHPPDLDAAPQRLADAVAVAGMDVAGRRRPRAVVLVIGKTPTDASSLSMARARRYLELLQVPFHIWSLHRKPRVPEAWGDVLDVSRPGAFERAAEDLGKALRRQWVVWLDGTYLPQDIRLAPDLESVTFAR